MAPAEAAAFPKEMLVSCLVPSAVRHPVVYSRPNVLRQWSSDDPAGELHQLSVLDDQTVCCAYGRYAHSSGSTTCSWLEFIEGRLDGVVLQAHGAVTLAQARDFVVNAARAA